MSEEKLVFDLCHLSLRVRACRATLIIVSHSSICESRDSLPGKLFDLSLEFADKTVFICNLRCQSCDYLAVSRVELAESSAICVGQSVRVHHYASLVQRIRHSCLQGCHLHLI